MMMERHEIIGLMAELKLAGMRHAYDEVIADALKRQNPVQHVVGDLLKAEVAEKQARSIKWAPPKTPRKFGPDLIHSVLKGSGDAAGGFVRFIGSFEAALGSW